MTALAEKVHEAMRGLRFGVEVEVVGIYPERIAAAVATAVGGEISRYDDSVTMPDGRVWRVERDGSLSTHVSGEVVSPVLTYTDLPLLQAVVRAVREAGGRADESCGVHVHVDGTRMTAKTVRVLAMLVFNREASLEAAANVRQARKDRYCRSMDPGFVERLTASRRTMRSLSRAWYGYDRHSPSRYDGSRYRGLNLNSLFFRGTVEFRWFNGTLHAGEVKAYVQLCLALAARSLVCSNVGRRQESGSLRHVTWTLTQILFLTGDEFETARLHLTKHLRARPEAGAPAAQEVADVAAAA